MNKLEVLKETLTCIFPDVKIDFHKPFYDYGFYSMDIRLGEWFFVIDWREQDGFLLTAGSNDFRFGGYGERADEQYKSFEGAMNRCIELIKNRCHRALQSDFLWYNGIVVVKPSGGLRMFVNIIPASEVQVEDIIISTDPTCSKGNVNLIGTVKEISPTVLRGEKMVKFKTVIIANLPGQGKEPGSAGSELKWVLKLDRQVAVIRHIS